MAKDVFDFKDTTTVVASNILTGFMDGTPITVEKNEDRYAQHVGADGQVTYNRSNNNTGTATLTLKQDSPSVPVLDALLKSDESFDITLSDSKRGKSVSGENCRFANNPSFTRGAEVEGVEYTILIGDYKED